MNTTSKELTEHWSEIFNRSEISYRFEFISPLMWTSKSGKFCICIAFGKLQTAGTRCRGFLVLETRCCGFLSSKKKPLNHNVVAYLSPFLDVMVFSPRISMSRFSGLGISLPWFFGLGIPISRYICLHGLVFVVIVKTKKSRIIISITFWKIFQLPKFMQHLSA